MDRSITMKNNNNTPPKRLLKDQSEYKRMHEFSWDLLLFVHNHNQNRNIITSPFAIHQSLSICANGAMGKSKDELMKLLDSNNINILNGCHQAINRIISDENDHFAKYVINNSVVIKSENAIQNDFKEQSKFYYKSQLINLNECNEIGMYLLNVEDDSILEMLIPIIKNIQKEPTIKLALINTILFNGKWSSSFDRDSTKEALFYDFENKEIKCDFMNKKESLLFIDNKIFTCVKKPYGMDNHALIILPKEKGTQAMNKLIKHLKENRDAFDKFESEEINISFPKFEIQFEQEFSDILKTMGVKTIFDKDHAQLDLISPNIYISSFLQNSKILVNEEGTKAQSVTSVFARSRGITKKKMFVLDRPFLFVIVNAVTDTIIFQVLIKNPLLK